MRILLSGGGTGGHVYPILAVVSELRRINAASPSRPHEEKQADRPRSQPSAEIAESSPAQTANGLELCYVGEAGGVEETLARRAGIPFKAISTGQIRGRSPVAGIRNSLRMAQGARQCAAVIHDFDPDVVFITGGYVAAPVALAAWQTSRGGRRRLPLLIYLPDLTPGLAIQLTSRLASQVAVSFEEVKPHFPGKAVVTGYPVREELMNTSRASARAALGLQDMSTVLLVFGGSRGARSINRALVGALPELLARCEVVHVSGQLDWQWVMEQAETLPAGLRGRYHAYPYLHDEMPQALVAADLVVARAGASTLGEFPAVGLPSVLVPYPYAGQHQYANAAYLAERGAALVVEDGDLATNLVPALMGLLDEPERMAKMAVAASRLACPSAAHNIAQALCELAGC